MKGILKISSTAFITTLCFLLVAYTACKKKTPTSPTGPCTGIVCQNSGTCLSGVCQCIPGFEGQYCEKASNLRYLGKWNASEIIIGSSQSSNKNKTKVYTLTIRKGEFNLDLLFDNFNNSYNNIKGIFCRRYEKGQLVFDNALQFAITPNQTPAGTYITILSGSGNVNDAGNNIVATYYTRYIENSIVVNDTISLTAEYMQ